MLSSFNTDLKPFEELAGSFAAKELVKKVEEHDRHPFGPFFSDVLDKAYEVGFLGVMLPEELGGIGQDIRALCIILDSICRADGSLGGIIFTSALAQEVMLAAGAHKEAGKIFSKAASAKEFLVAYPSFCNPGQLVKLPHATKSGRNYLLTGEIEYVVMGGIASRALIPARIDDQAGYSFLLADLSDKGLEKSEPVFSLGFHACPAVDVTFKGVKARLVGEEGRGSVYFDAASRKMHVAAAAMNAGIMKGSFNEALAYAKERFQGGREIINWSEVSMILANMLIKANVADLCVAQACQAVRQENGQWGRHCMAAALHVHELACDATSDGIQVLGGNGYMKDYGQEKRYRDARQVQALLGIAPLKKIALIREAAGLDDPCAPA
ncbi:MAG: acyl-CoA dehydrogenase family protein [Deltaproteobacteria bacterium]|nr:acyl-CoA dehydrogenase family protein [Deltaproteobacteria bacterium]